MVSELRIYFEGDPQLRKGMSEFLGEIRGAARERRCGFRLIAGEATPVADFCTALADHQEAWNLLLVDSEGPDDGKLFEKLRQRRGWNPPAGSGELAGRVFWMVQLMEAWFLADMEALNAFYGQGFRKNVLAGNPHVEEVPKADVLSSLKQATRDTGKGTYHKTKHAPEILMGVDPNKVKAAAPNCKRLFDTVLERLQQQE